MTNGKIAYPKVLAEVKSKIEFNSNPTISSECKTFSINNMTKAQLLIQVKNESKKCHDRFIEQHYNPMTKEELQYSLFKLKYENTLEEAGEEGVCNKLCPFD